MDPGCTVCRSVPGELGGGWRPGQTATHPRSSISRVCVWVESAEEFVDWAVADGRARMTEWSGRWPSCGTDYSRKLTF